MYRDLESRVSLLEQMVKRRFLLRNQNAINEAKSVGTLYHVCTLDAYLEYIKPKDQLKSSCNYTNWLYGGDDYVSFTRDKNFIVNTREVNRTPILIQLVIDGNKLSENYKVRPYNDFAFGSYDEPKYREKEECVRGPIKSISKYIKHVYLDMLTANPLLINTIKSLNAPEVEYNNFAITQNKGFDKFKRENLKTGDNLEKVAAVLDEYESALNESPLTWDPNEANVFYQLKHGAKITSDVDWRSFFSLGSYSLVQLMFNKGLADFVNMYEVLLYALNNSSYDIIKTVIKYVDDLNKKLPNRKSPLYTEITHPTFRGGRTTVVRDLIKRGANKNEITDTGDSLYDIAVKMGSKPGILKLLQ